MNGLDFSLPITNEFVDFCVLFLAALSSLKQFFFTNIIGIILFGVLLVVGYFIFRWIYRCWLAKREVLEIKSNYVAKATQDYSKLSATIDDLMDLVFEKLVKENDNNFAFALGHVRDKYKNDLKKGLSLALYVLEKGVTKCCSEKETKLTINAHRIFLLREDVDFFCNKLPRLQANSIPREIRILTNGIESNLVNIEKNISGGPESFVVDRVQKTKKPIKSK